MATHLTKNPRHWGWGVVALLCAAPARADVLMERQSADANDLLAVERQHPAALSLLKEAEALLAAGRAVAAAEKLVAARAQAPKSAVIARRYCQALTQQGRRSAAITACEVAQEQTQSPMTNRAIVGALMLAEPTPTELAQALRLTARAKQDLAAQPWGYAAECDIARRLGDRAMYKNCLDHLETMAPGHYEAVRARALGGFADTPRWVPLLWLVLAAAACATLAHALWSRLRRSSGATAVAALLLLSSSGHAYADVAAPSAAAPELQPAEASMQKRGGLSKWKINDADPLKSLPTTEQRDSDPLNYGYHLMDLADKAQEAAARGDFAAESRYWEATVLAVPDVAVGYRKTCVAAEKAKNLNRAFRYCRAALGRSGVELADYEHYFALLQASPEVLQPEQLTDLLEMAKHARTLNGAERLADSMECEYGLRANDLARLEACTNKLAAAAPDDPRTITYQWTLALGRERYDDARKLIERARKTAMKPAGIAAMEQATAQRSSVWATLWRRPKLVVGGGIAALVLAGIWAFSRLFSRRRAKPATGAALPTA